MRGGLEGGYDNRYALSEEAWWSQFLNFIQTLASVDIDTKEAFQASIEIW